MRIQRVESYVNLMRIIICNVNMKDLYVFFDQISEYWVSRVTVMDEISHRFRFRRRKCVKRFKIDLKIRFLKIIYIKVISPGSETKSTNPSRRNISHNFAEGNTL